MHKFLFASLLATLTVTAAQATPIATNTWYEFSFNTVGTPAYACNPGSCAASSGTPTVSAGSAPYTFANSGAYTLLVQDAFLPGDAFSVFDFDSLIGSTPMVAGDQDHDCGSDPVVCANDPLMSRGAFLLGSGVHSISLVPTESVVNSGAAYFEVVPNVATSLTPEPSAFVLLGTGLVGAMVTLRRRLLA